jgi:amidase
VSITTVTDLCRMGATELAEAIRSGQVSSCEVAGAHLRRIEGVNPAINAVPIVLGERALKAAREADRAAASGAELPPLHGVPFTVKGNIDLASTPTTHVIKALAAAYPAMDAPAVGRMRAAGAIPIGLTGRPQVGGRRR